MDEVNIEAIAQANEKLKEMAKRKETILKTIEEQGKLTDALKERIENCWDATELEDIYLPFKPKRRTRAQIAREAGLEPLAQVLLFQRERNPLQAAKKFVGDKVKDADAALQGAKDIIAEMVSESEESRNQIRGEKPAPEPKKETSKSAPTPDIDEVLEIEEPSEDEITERMGKFDTGFVVQGRYDLSATSEIGLKLGLTEEQKQLFSYFVPIRGVSEQLVEILDNDKLCRNRYGTSRTGNILILGRKGSGKTVLAVDIVKAIQKQRRLKQGKVAIVTGDSLNKKDIGSIIDKLNGGALIIEKASKMNDRTIRELNDMMDEQTGELLFLLEDQKKPLERMFASHREFKRKFTSRLELPVFINDELVTFGQTYAKENGYRIDEMGILALYSRIDMMQREDHAVTVAEVKEIMDEAISHSQKANVKHLVKRVFGRSTDNSDHIILKEEDFKA